MYVIAHITSMEVASRKAHVDCACNTLPSVISVVSHALPDASGLSHVPPNFETKSSTKPFSSLHPLIVPNQAVPECLGRSRQLETFATYRR
jgi:hypothetical protein